MFFKDLATDTPDEARFVEKLAQDHVSMVRTFEQKNLIEEGEFINKEGIYVVFEGFCGIYQKKKEPLPKIDAFGKQVVETTESVEEEKTEGSAAGTSNSKILKKDHLELVML